MVSRKYERKASLVFLKFFEKSSYKANVLQAIRDTGDSITFIQRGYKEHALIRQTRINTHSNIMWPKALGVLTKFFVLQKKRYPALQDMGMKINMISEEIK